MFKQALIYYPADEENLDKISKTLVEFRCEEAAKRIETLGLTEGQIEALFADFCAEQKLRCKRLKNTP